MKASYVAIGVLVAVAAFAILYDMRPPPPIHAIPEAPAKPVHVSTVGGRPIPRKPQLAVAFRLDPEVTHGLYMGDRWVSPPSYYFAQRGKEFVVQAKPQHIDTRGERVDLSGDWLPADPEMVAVTRRHRGEVTIVVRRPGQTKLTVSTGAGTKVVNIRATQLDDAMQVEFTQ